MGLAIGAAMQIGQIILHAVKWVVKHVRIGDKKDSQEWIEKKDESVFLVIDIGTVGSLLKSAVNSIEDED